MKFAEGPYSVKRVYHEPDVITYEVSAGGNESGYHVIFDEDNCLDLGISAKEQAELYAASPDLYNALEVAKIFLEQIADSHNVLIHGTSYYNQICRALGKLK
jgi:hypothetical protein